MANASIWREQAQYMVDRYGYAEALRLAMRDRNNSSEGTASFAFHNAVQKEIRQLAPVDQVSKKS